MDVTQQSADAPNSSAPPAPSQPQEKSIPRPYKCPYPLCGRAFSRLEHQVSLRPITFGNGWNIWACPWIPFHEPTERCGHRPAHRTRRLGCNQCRPLSSALGPRLQPRLPRAPAFLSCCRWIDRASGHHIVRAQCLSDSREWNHPWVSLC